MSLIFYHTAAAGIMVNIATPTDERAMQVEDYVWSGGRIGRVHIRPWFDGQLWAKSRVMCGDYAAPLVPFGSDACDGGCYDLMLEENGGQQKLKIIGQTLDANGNPLASCTVRAFLTATKTFVNECTSDSAGYFELPSQFPGQQHYLVAYRGGAPDVTGASVNTLTPA